jgi:rod shape-determining protein MreC
MRNLFRFIIQYQFVILFLLIESFSMFLLFNSNPYQRFVFYKASRNFTGRFSNGMNKMKDYFSLGADNRKLFDENTRLFNEVAELSSVMSDTLKAETEKDAILHYIPAEVINITVNNQYNYITIDKGSKDSIEPDMAVICAEGIVGYTRSVSRNFTLVMPALNRDFMVSGKIKKNGYYGPVIWDGNSTSFLTLGDIPYHVDVATGDTIVTSGFGRTFPEGYPIGTIEDFKLKGGNYYQITVRMFTDFHRLNYVHVVKSNAREEIDSLQNSIVR